MASYLDDASVHADAWFELKKKPRPSPEEAAVAARNRVTVHTRISDGLTDAVLKMDHPDTGLQTRDPT